LVLGRLEQGIPQGPKSGVFKLNPNFTDADSALASQWLTAFGPIPPVPTPPTPAVAPAQQWGAQQPPAEPLPYDQWQNTPGAVAAPSAWQQPAQPATQPLAAPQQWQAEQAAQQPPAQAWAQPAAPAPQTWQQPAQVAAQPPQTWQQQPVPAPHQDPALVAKLQSHSIVVTPEMSMEQLQMIANSFPK
jgi:hypothetical protein